MLWQQDDSEEWICCLHSNGLCNNKLALQVEMSPDTLSYFTEFIIEEAPADGLDSKQNALMHCWTIPTAGLLWRRLTKWQIHTNAICCIGGIWLTHTTFVAKETGWILLHVWRLQSERHIQKQMVNTRYLFLAVNQTRDRKDDWGEEQDTVVINVLA